MQVLREVLQRVKLSKSNCLYNRRLIDIYLLASHGLIIVEKHNNSITLEQSQKKSEFIARCENSQCGLVIELDDFNKMSQIKNDLELEIVDHDIECKFKKVDSNVINFKLFEQLGHEIYRQNRQNIKKNNKYLQLSPEEIKEALNISNESSVNYKLNLKLQMFKKIDKYLQNNELLKVSSSAFLAVFGWAFSQEEENTVFCQFCNKSKNIFEFISPSQCTLMTLTFGFKFMSEHRPWCCLVAPQSCFWKDILRQVVIKQAINKEGSVSKTSQQIRSREIKANLIKIYTNHYNELTTINKKIIDFKGYISGKYKQQDNEVRVSLQQSCLHLQKHLLEGQEIIETFIKKVKLQ